MKLPSPTSVLDASANGWHGKGKPTICTSFGLQNEVLGVDRGYLVNKERIVDTKIYEASATCTTVGDEGTPSGSTELDRAAGRNCRLTNEELLCASLYFDRIDPEGYGGKNTSNMWQCWAGDVHAVINYSLGMHSHVPGDGQLCGIPLARLARVMCGPEALTPWILQQGFIEHAEPEVLLVLGGKEGHFELLGRHMLRRSIVGRNMLNHWLQEGELFGDTRPENWGKMGETLGEIFDVLRDDDTITYVREKASSGSKIVKILMDRLRSNPGWEHAVWDDVAASWFRDFLTKGDADDSTGYTNGLFYAFGLR